MKKRLVLQPVRSEAFHHNDPIYMLLKHKESRAPYSSIALAVSTVSFAFFQWVYAAGTPLSSTVPTGCGDYGMHIMGQWSRVRRHVASSWHHVLRLIYRRTHTLRSDHWMTHLRCSENGNSVGIVKSIHLNPVPHTSSWVFRFQPFRVLLDVLVRA